MLEGILEVEGQNRSYWVKIGVSEALHFWRLEGGARFLAFSSSRKPPPPWWLPLWPQSQQRGIFTPLSGSDFCCRHFVLNSDPLDSLFSPSRTLVMTGGPPE